MTAQIIYADFRARREREAAELELAIVVATGSEPTYAGSWAWRATPAEWCAPEKDPA